MELVVFYFRKCLLSTNGWNLLFFRAELKTILGYMRETILWYYLKQYWRTVFVPHNLPSITIRL